MNSDPSLKSLNTIAYDKTLRLYIKDLQDVLDSGITDISAQAVQLSVRYKEDAVKQLKFMSKLTADLSVALIKAKGNKELNAQEQEQFNTIKKLADSFGNLQFRINRLIMDITKMESLGNQISEEATVLLDSVTDVQSTILDIRAKINDLGFFSQNPEIAILFDKEDGQDK